MSLFIIALLAELELKLEKSEQQLESAKVCTVHAYPLIPGFSSCLKLRDFRAGGSKKALIGQFINIHWNDLLAHMCSMNSIIFGVL